MGEGGRGMRFFERGTGKGMRKKSNEKCRDEFSNWKNEYS